MNRPYMSDSDMLRLWLVCAFCAAFVMFVVLAVLAVLAFG